MTAIIVDDEKHCREVLEHLLTRHCPDVQVMASCKDGAEALKVLDHQSPDLLFLDIEMPGMNGFEVLEQSTRHDFDIIFTTAYNEYAIKAIRHSALDYLLKPVDKDELILAVQRAQDRKPRRSTDVIKDFLENINVRKMPRRFAASTLEGLIMVNADDILYCESDSAYCKLVFVDGRSMLLSKTPVSYTHL